MRVEDRVRMADKMTIKKTWKRGKYTYKGRKQEKEKEEKIKAGRITHC